MFRKFILKGLPLSEDEYTKNAFMNPELGKKWKDGWEDNSGPMKDILRAAHEIKENSLHYVWPVEIIYPTVKCKRCGELPIYKEHEHWLWIRCQSCKDRGRIRYDGPGAFALSHAIALWNRQQRPFVVIRAYKRLSKKLKQLVRKAQMRLRYIFN